MKKIKFMSAIALIASLVAGCSCSNVDDSTYAEAVSKYKNTDGIAFTRIELITTEGASTYTRKKVEASFVFDANKEVLEMAYSLSETENNSSGGSAGSPNITEYYYSKSSEKLSSYKKIGSEAANYSPIENTTYTENFNAAKCSDSDCSLLIIGNFAPIYTLEEISEFVIEEDKGKGIAYYTGICPSYENCQGNSQMLNYTIHINEDGNIESLSYDVVNGKTTHSIKYAFSAYGSDKVNVTVPKNLENYK